MKKRNPVSIVVVITVGYFYFFQPHITYKEVRVTYESEEIKAVYVNVTGDPLCAKLYILDHMENNKPVASKEPLFLAMPMGIPSPEDGGLAYSNNIFVFKGYRYQLKENNKLTNSSEELNSHRFDVIAWSVVTPYKKWKVKTNVEEINEPEIFVEPVSYKLDDTYHTSSQFVKGKYVDCLR